MKYNYIIKYSGDIGNKKSTARKFFINKINENIYKTLKDNAIKFKIYTYWDFIYLESNNDIKEILKRSTGIQYFSECKRIFVQSLEDLIQKSKQYFAKKVENKKFAVRCKNKIKKEKKTFSSKEVEIELGNALLPYSSGVNLTNPELICYVEIKDEGVFLYSNKIKAQKGFPTGSNGKVLLMLSGGIDSPVACIELLKKGMSVDFVFFDLGNCEQKNKLINLYNFLKKNYLQGKSLLFIVPFEKVIMEIINKIRPKYRNLILKYFFYKVSEKIADENNFLALATGESLSQVSTQTLKNIIALDKTTKYTILRPLLFLNKEEIINKAKEYEIFDKTFKGKEYCAITKGKVVIASSYNKIIKELASINTEEIISNALSKLYIYSESNKNKDYNKITLSKKDSDFRIIDLRTKKDASIYRDKTIEIDFSRAWQDFISWDKGLKYYIICDSGVKSKMLATFMKEEGYDAIIINKIPDFSHSDTEN